MVNEVITRQKRGRPVGSKDKNPRKRRGANESMEANDSKRDTLPVEEDRDIVRTSPVVQISDIIETPEDVQVPEK